MQIFKKIKICYCSKNEGSRIGVHLAIEIKPIVKCDTDFCSEASVE